MSEPLNVLPPVIEFERPTLEPAALEVCDYGTDLDASLRFVEDVADGLRYCIGIGWLAWDGKRWAIDGADHRAIELSKRAARKWTTRAGRVHDEGRASRIKTALTLEGASHVKNAVDLAKSDPRLAVTVNQLDTGHMLLNVSNGTIDLHTGKLRPHDRADLITKLAPVNFEPQARHPALDRYLLDLCADIPNMADFLARCAGYALTGDASAESVFLIQGPGGNGKTTLLESFAAFLGDYAVKMEFSSLCTSTRHGGRGAGSASPDIVKLRGSRLAYASEGDQSARLDAGIVKLLSGGETITARDLYETPITFPQTFKLWLVSNYDPRCDADDSGLWRRLVKVPFAALRGKPDPTLKTTLVNDSAARAALLAWAVRGCLDWQERGSGRIGLGVPEQVEAATAAYRSEQDTTGAWFAELLADVAVLDCNGSTVNKDLRIHYERWCAENGASSLSLPRFSMFLAERGLFKRTSKSGMVWRGIRLVSTQ
jgi:putative DNA primase/helicase